jgi:hypothetical protein
VKVASTPEALLAVLKNAAYHFKRIGLEAGPLSQWLFSAGLWRKPWKSRRRCNERNGENRKIDTRHRQRALCYCLEPRFSIFERGKKLLGCGYVAKFNVAYWLFTSLRCAEQ